MNFLYRRELHREDDLTVIYDDQAQRKKIDALVIESIQYQFGLPMVHYTAFKPNFTKIIDVNRSQEEKAALLAQAAIDSITHETFDKGLDGIQYLADNIDSGVVTVLTEPYAQAVLEKAGNAPNLNLARRFIAQQKGIIA